MGILVLALVGSGAAGKLFKKEHTMDFDGNMGPNVHIYSHLVEKVKEDAALALDLKEVKDISLYYRDLKSGNWFAINKDEKFNTASLMKVPLMMECLESAESHPSLIKKRLLFNSNEDWTLQQNIKPAKTLVPGNTYSLDQLLFRMMAYSDNNAVQLVLQEFPTDNLCRFLVNHNIDFEKDQEGFKMSLGTYSRLFEALYNQSLLNSTMSQKALSYLAAEDFPQGMHAALPPGITVESKFGEKIVQDISGKVVSTQLHEVGIIQDGNRSFLLGIMTSGYNLTVLKRTIQNITHDIYEELNKAEHPAGRVSPIS